MKHNIAGQEEACAALWDFAREVLELPAEARGSFAERPEEKTVQVNGEPMHFRVRHVPSSDAEIATVRRALARIVKGFGFEVAKIQ